MWPPTFDSVVTRVTVATGDIWSKLETAKHSLSLHRHCNSNTASLTANQQNSTATSPAPSAQRHTQDRRLENTSAQARDSTFEEGEKI